MMRHDEESAREPRGPVCREEAGARWYQAMRQAGHGPWRVGHGISCMCRAFFAVVEIKENRVDNVHAQVDLDVANGESWLLVFRQTFG